MDTGHDVDPVRFRRIIDGHDVVILRFDLLEPRLLVDRRQANGQDPLVTLLPRVGNMHERLEMLRHLRPGLRYPRQVRVLRWPRSIASFQRLGVWDHIQHHCGERWRPVLDELLEHERRAQLDAIRGTGFHALWESSTSP